MGQLADLVEEFCRRDVAPKTRDAYGYPLRGQLLPWCAAEGLTRPEQLDPDAIDRFGLELQRHLTPKGAPLRPASRRTYMKAVQQFVSWLQKRKGVDGVDPAQVQLPRLRKQHREVLSRTEVQALEDAAPSERNKLVIRLMGDTGAREGEVAGLRLDDVIARDGRFYYVRVSGKTGSRMSPVSAALYRRLQAYAAGKTGRPRSSSRVLFLASRRRPGGDYEPLTVNGIYQLVKDAVQRAGIGKRVYPHLLRHSAITHLVAKGTHPALVSDIVGVSVSVIAQHYSHPNDQDRWEAMSALWD